MPILQISLIVVWVAIMVCSLIIEAETAQLVSIWFGVGAIPALICASFNVAWYIQLIIFVSVSCVLLLATRPLAKKLTKGSNLKTNVDRLIDSQGIVTKTIVVDGKGEVKVGNLIWTAISKRNIEIAEGTKVIIQQIDGNKVIVDIIEEINI